MSSSQFTALAPHYDELMDVVPYAAWVDYVMLLFSLVEHEPHAVLDCACGTGNVTYELARHGLAVTGVDVSLGMIAQAQAKRAAMATTPRFFQADLTQFALGETFDSATCLYDSLNYILEPTALQAAFVHIARHVARDGVFVFDMNSEYALQADLFTQRSRRPEKALNYDWQAHFDPATHICSVEMHFTRRGATGTVERFEEVHRERAYPRAQIEAMLATAGWELLKTFDAYTVNHPHDRSERWYFVARRQ